MLSKLVPIALIFFSTFAHAERNIQIAGVHFGMSMDQARAAISKFDPSLSLGQTARGNQILSVLARGKGPYLSQVEAALHEGKVWHIGREQHFEDRKGPSLSDFLKSLEEKLGPPNGFERQAFVDEYAAAKAGKGKATTHYLFWYFDRQGNANPKVCGREAFAENGLNGAKVPTNCGVAAWARITAENSREGVLTSRYKLWVANAALVSDLNVAAQQVADKKRRQEDEERRRNPPKASF